MLVQATNKAKANTLQDITFGKILVYIYGASVMFNLGFAFFAIKASQVNIALVSIVITSLALYNIVFQSREDSVSPKLLFLIPIANVFFVVLFPFYYMFSSPKKL